MNNEFKESANLTANQTGLLFILEGRRCLTVIALLSAAKPLRNGGLEKATEPCILGHVQELENRRGLSLPTTRRSPVGVP